jgi:hypothetical protein
MALPKFPISDLNNLFKIRIYIAGNVTCMISIKSKITLSQIISLQKYIPMSWVEPGPCVWKVQIQTTTPRGHEFKIHQHVQNTMVWQIVWLYIGFHEVLLCSYWAQIISLNSSVGWALDCRSKGPLFDPCLSQIYFIFINCIVTHLMMMNFFSRFFMTFCCAGQTMNNWESHTSMGKGLTTSEWKPGNNRYGNARRHPWQFNSCKQQALPLPLRSFA